jgi:hypothetical protein
MTLGLEIDGINMRTSAWNVSTQTGRFSMPPVRGDDLVLPGRSGYVFTPNKPYDAGIGVLSVWVTGANSNGTFPTTHTLRQQQMRTNIAQMQRMFLRRHKLSTIRAWQPDGSIRQCLAQWTDWGEPTVQADGTRAEWTMGFSIPGVFWKDETDTSQQTATGSTLPKTLSLTSFDNMTGVIEDSVLSVTGPITNPRITDSETGQYVQYTGTLASSAVWTVDCGAFTSLVGATNVLSSTTHGGGYRFLTISNVFGSSTTPQLVLTGTAGGTNTKFGIVARRKWVNG